MLTGKQIYEMGIVTDVTMNSNDIANSVQQHSVDLRLSKVYRIHGDIKPGVIYCDKKTTLAYRQEIFPGRKEYLARDDKPEQLFYVLLPGTYEITFIEGCCIPADRRGFIVHRSSLFRNGGSITSAIFDAGFKTNQIGTMMVITERIEIEYNARIGTFYVDDSNVVENLYSGQFQGDIQRKTNQV